MSQIPYRRPEWNTPSIPQNPLELRQEPKLVQVWREKPSMNKHPLSENEVELEFNIY
jgi:hypothetical protein